MAASRTLRSSIFRVFSSDSSLSGILSSYTRTHLTKPYTSTASTDELLETGVRTDVPGSHPWPEWFNFIDKLKNKGYFFDKDPLTGSADLSRPKYACLTFARDRSDIFKLLSREDIETVVKYGCPSLNPKTVNSAKRLRAFVGLDEGDVCSGCNLRGSCDRANMKLKDSEGAAGTVDVVRMLLTYALDPLVHSSEKPNGREYVEASARRLLSELSEATLDPALPNSNVKPRRKLVDLKKAQYYQNVEMKKGDWICSKCSFMNYGRNIRCLKCNEDGPKRVSVDNVEMKKGDWTCPKCDFMNFSRNRSCYRCQGPRPKRELQPGEWECPSCDYVNFRNNTACLRSSCGRPKDIERAVS
ncbi:hypothetical protein MKW94_022450 [Papaver nudicaule]|uniref:RanBP2-type domain-containing protein n=1 Tax=Papaver nudicaule TaxID=74823 RepID=A0AA41SB30_PAPNU|nr:hypothetical protein [Papaver nudicaule]